VVTAREAESSFDAWLRGLADTEGLTRKGHAVLDVLRTRPRFSAFTSSRGVAVEADVNVGTVTRAAQALGFSGWSELQQEFRSRYMTSLSAVEVADEHSRAGTGAPASVARDRAALEYVERSSDLGAIAEAARRIVAARRTLVVAQGSYAAIGIALTHNAGLAGHDIVHVDDPAAIANGLARMEQQDLLVAINCWQVYASTVTALEQAARQGIGAVLISDSAAPPAGIGDTLRIAVPSEGVSFFPSLAGALAVAQAIVVELAAAEPERTREALARSETQWREFGLLRHDAR
jgi:DNA-binding MurR/RpiR family transcriptional regulator